MSRRGRSLSKNALLYLMPAVLLVSPTLSFSTQEAPQSARATAVAAAPADVAPIPIDVAPTPAVPDPRYRLRPGDILTLNFPFVPDFDQTVTVQPDGFVSLRVRGPLRVEGMTVPELVERLRAEYSTILRDPVITVELKEFEKPYFVVAGGVERPGKFELRGDTTVTQAVAVAGGLKKTAREKKAVVFRRLATGGYESKQVDLKQMMKKADLNADVRLNAGDILFIPGGRGPEFSDFLSSLWIVTLF